MREMTRREFLKESGKLGAVLGTLKLTGRLRPEVDEAKAVEYDYSFQYDVPPGYALAKVGWFESIDQISKKAKVSIEQLKRENGIGEQEKIVSGEYLLIPVVSGATMKYVENTDVELKKQFIVRAVRNPDLSPEEDFTEQELLILNRLLRWSEKVKKQYLGEISMTRGFGRLMRAAETDMDYDPAEKSGQVSTRPVCSFPLAEEMVEAKIGCKVGGDAKVIFLYPGTSSLGGYDYYESLMTGYGLEMYVRAMANIVLHEYLHLVIVSELRIPPFGEDIDGDGVGDGDNHRLIYALATLAYDEYIDRMGNVSMMDTEEWYLIRQNPSFFERLLSRYLARLKNPPSNREVYKWIREIYPDYFKWKEMYELPISEVLADYGRLLWTKKPGAYDVVTWAIPSYNVRWPKPGEDEWMADYWKLPIRRDGMKLYLSWKVIGTSRYGKVPEVAKKFGAVPFSGDKKENFDTYGGIIKISPVSEAAYPVGKWQNDMIYF